MAAKNRNDLKSHFETGDIPTGNDFSDLIDSVFNLEEDAFLGMKWAGQWQAQGYSVQEVVSHNGGLFVCIQVATANEDPAKAAFWQPMISPAAGSASISQLYFGNPTMGGWYDFNNGSAAEIGRFISPSAPSAIKATMYSTLDEVNAVVEFRTTTGTIIGSLTADVNNANGIVTANLYNWPDTTTIVVVVAYVAGLNTGKLSSILIEY